MNQRYNKLSEAWGRSRPPPNSPEEVSKLIVNTLKNHKKADVKVLSHSSYISVYKCTKKSNKNSKFGILNHFYKGFAIVLWTTSTSLHR